MSIKDNLTKKNTSLLLMTALIIGVIVVITQLASAGSQKNENPLIQNTKLNDSSKYKPVVNNSNTIISNVTKPAVQTSNSVNNVTKPAVQTSNSVNNVTKPAVQTSNSILGIINSSAKNNSEIVNLQTIKIPKADQVADKKDSESKPITKTKPSDKTNEIKNKIQTQQKDDDNISHNIADKKTNDKVELKTKKNHASTQSHNEDNKLQDHLNHKINKPLIDSIPPQSFDLPFTAVVPKDLF